MSLQSSQHIDTKTDLIKRTICKGSTDDEFELFSAVCRRTGLDPFMRQIYPVPRWSNKDKRYTMTIQTSIDGFRLIAERTGNYSPGREPLYVYDDNKKIISATSYVKKRTSDGTWHEVAATAYFEEYVQKDKDGKVTQFWSNMPHVMLAKCAESIALRRAFPAEMSGIYTKDEMEQADVMENVTVNPPVIEQKITEEQSAQLDVYLEEFPDSKKGLCEKFGLSDVYDLEQKDFGYVVNVFEKRRKVKDKT